MAMRERPDDRAGVRGQHPLEARVLDALYMNVGADAVERAEEALSEILQERHAARARLADAEAERDVAVRERDEAREALREMALGWMAGELRWHDAYCEVREGRKVARQALELFEAGQFDKAARAGAEFVPRLAAAVLASGGAVDSPAGETR